MYKKYLIAAVAALLTALPVMTFTSCSDDDDVSTIIIEPDDVPLLSADHYDKGRSTTVTSERGPQHGQNHRSSDNFSTTDLGKDMSSAPTLLYISAPDGVTFDIMEDVKGGTDTYHHKQAYNGCIITYFSSSRAYIANPSGAGSSFNVKLTALRSKGSVTFVSSLGRHLDGQDHRASENFSFAKNIPMFKVHCSDPNATFGIYNDVFMASDDKIALNVKDGDFINLSSELYNYYITDPDGNNGKPFTVMFEPWVYEWMTSLDDSKSIAELSIPGTHDTATNGIEVSAGWSRTQNFDYNHQLDFGIRYFDLRVEDDLSIVHGIRDANTSLPKILDITLNFFKYHPKEVILMELTDEDPGMPAAFKKLLDNNPKYKELFYFGTHVPTLGEVRGKIVTIRRFNKPDDGDWGIDVKSIWPHDTWGSGTNADGVKYYIEDRYYAASEPIHDSKEKSRMLKNAMYHATLNPDCLTLAFSSIAARGSHTPWDYAWGAGPILEVDPVMNEALRDILAEINEERYLPMGVGVVIMDYYNRRGHDDYCHNVETIINMNFPKASPLIDMTKLHSDRD